MATEIKTKKKNYIKGSAKEVVFNNGGSVIHVDLLLKDLDRLPKNEAGYVKITISRLPAPDKYNNTHTIYENDWKPEPGNNKKAATTAKTQVKSLRAERASDDLPF
jgi:hypothetical protein